MINHDAIVGWKQQIPWRQEIHVEQDLLLHAMIQILYTRPLLREKLAFRGGTCLNKLFWKEPARYSEDLDFVQVKAEKIGPTTDELRMALKDIFTEEPAWECRKGSFKLYYYFYPESNPQQKQRIKIEINTREHVAFDGYTREKLFLRSLWRNGEAEVLTFTKEELLATKLRALYQRRKGRDLFDLWKSNELHPDYKKVSQLFLKYMEISGKKITRKLLIKNCEEKLSDKIFLNDIYPLINPKLDYDPLKAFEFVQAKILTFIP